MLKKAPTKLLAALLAVLMLVGMVPFTAFATGSVTNYADFLANLKQLEIYADEFASQSSRDPGELVLNFIRTGVERYQVGNWAALAGVEITVFTEYVEEQDAANGTSVMDLRDIVIKDFTLPNGNPADFGHMSGTMNISYVNAAVQSDDLAGWAGDLCDLLYFGPSAPTCPTAPWMRWPPISASIASAWMPTMPSVGTTSTAIWTPTTWLTSTRRATAPSAS